MCHPQWDESELIPQQEDVILSSSDESRSDSDSYEIQETDDESEDIDVTGIEESEESNDESEDTDDESDNIDDSSSEDEWIYYYPVIISSDDSEGEVSVRQPDRTARRSTRGRRLYRGDKHIIVVTAVGIF